MDPYAVLGVPENASAREVRAAYLAQARRHHPDSYATADARARAEAEVKMREVNQAWSMLATETARAEHDRTRRPPESSSHHRPGRADEPFTPYEEGYDPPMPAEDIAKATGFARWMAVLPVTLFASAFGLLIVGAMTGITPLLALAVVCFLGAIGGFLVAPLVALSASAKADKGG